MAVLVLGGSIAAAGFTLAQAAPPTSSGTRARKPTPEMASVTGTVKTYREGKSIVIVGPDGRGRKLFLDGTTRIDGPVRRGQEVTAVWMTDDAGRPHVNAISTNSRPVAEARAAGNAPLSPTAGVAPPPEPTPRETTTAPTATPHAPVEDGATTPSARRTPLPNPP